MKSRVCNKGLQRVGSWTEGTGKETEGDVIGGDYAGVFDIHQDGLEWDEIFECGASIC